MRCLSEFLCVCALGLVPLAGCSEGGGEGGIGGSAGTAGMGGDGGNGGVCDDLGVYECIDQPSCTSRFQRGYLDCSATTREDCAERAEGPVPEGGRSVCIEFLREDGTSYFAYVLVAFCEQDSDCLEGEVCGVLGIVGEMMIRAECYIPCVSECEQDADCPEGDSCFFNVCGVCGGIPYFCADTVVGFCS